MKSRTGLVVMLVLGALAAVLLAVPAASAQDMQPPYGITVSGQGSTNVAPDVADLNVGVQTNGATAKQALDDNGAQMQKVIDAVLATGVAAGDVQTVGVSVYPQVGPPNPDGSQPVTSYQANNSVTVRVRDISRVGEVLDAAFNAGANTSGGVSFGLLDPSGAQHQALGEALADARAKAEAIAASLGKQVGEVLAVWEEPTYGPQPYASKADNTPIQPGNVAITAQVRVTYELK